MHPNEPVQCFLHPEYVLWFFLLLYSTAILAEPTSVKPEISPSSGPDSSVTSQSVTSQAVMETKVEESAGEVVDREDVKKEAEEDLEAGEENGEGDEAGKIDLKYWSRLWLWLTAIGLCRIVSSPNLERTRYFLTPFRCHTSIFVRFQPVIC